VVRLESGLVRQVFDLELDGETGNTGNDFVEEGRSVTVTEVDLAEDPPRVRRHLEAPDRRVMGKDEFPVRGPSNIELDRIGD
jgi:hypothetical protein